jgi:SAM-dependent methyltransferase
VDSRATTRRNTPSIFASDVVSYFPRFGTILDLGAGSGWDSRFFATLGYYVVSTDIASTALRLSIGHTPNALEARIAFLSFDMRTGFPFQSNAFEVVYAHLSLHYFDRQTTLAITGEVDRVLKSGGVFAFLTNSTHDSERDTGLEIEKDLFLIKETDGEVPKRYFSVDSTKQFVTRFETVILDDGGEADSKAARGVHNLIRFVGRRK